ncbi:hypothetical protein DFQ14_12614 [Halopolyspora algeriensis]|uniref:Uncharacterized protein n=2 Tax=Halopolyspora algeriensis TaxID=1500506 RepID=A0A368V955_9ACTN|nr:hypothetical protein DFQ14_12614 [Halopolyspora algeriensis]TQM46237.1 hypothetical protein FHU43_3907 [Halopolyspora algeriensis]
MWPKRDHAEAGTDQPLRPVPHTAPGEEDPPRTQHHGRSRFPATATGSSGAVAAGRPPVFEPGEVDDIADLLNKATAHVEPTR